MKKATLKDCTLLELPKIADPRGNLTFIEGGTHVGFAIKRVFYLYDAPAGAERGGHALKNCHQLLIASSGSFRITVTDGEQRREVGLSRPYQGLLIPPMIWREIDDFSSGAVCLVLASKNYDAADYFRKYPEYLAAMARTRGRNAGLV